MSLVFEVASAMSEAVNCLCVLLEWNDAGAIATPPVDRAKLSEAMHGLEGAFREVLHGAVREAMREGRMSPMEPPIVEDDLARVLRIEELIPAWPSTGALPSELVTLAEACVSALGGASWREIMAEARRAAAALSP